MKAQIEDPEFTYTEWMVEGVGSQGERFAMPVRLTDAEDSGAVLRFTQAKFPTLSWTVVEMHLLYEGRRFAEIPVTGGPMSVHNGTFTVAGVGVHVS